MVTKLVHVNIIFNYVLLAEKREKYLQDNRQKAMEQRQPMTFSNFFNRDGTFASNIQLDNEFFPP